MIMDVTLLRYNKHITSANITHLITIHNNDYISLSTLYIHNTTSFYSVSTSEHLNTINAR